MINLNFCFYQCPNRTSGAKELAAMAISRFDIPGDPDFPRELNNMYAKPKNPTEMETMRGYLTQLRQELGVRLLDKVYRDDNSPPSKVRIYLFVRDFYTLHSIMNRTSLSPINRIIKYLS